MTRVALYFGSFNPFHYGHRAVAQGVSDSGLVDALWFVLSPKSPFKGEELLGNSQQRLQSLTKAIADIDTARWSVCDIEFRLPSPLYTIRTVEALEKEHPDCEFSIVMGADNLDSLERWYCGRDIMARWRLIVYPRPGCDLSRFYGYAVDEQGRALSPMLGSDYAFKELVILKDAPQNDISSTRIRNGECCGGM